jgi:glucosamine-6-phosphate deaminase
MKRTSAPAQMMTVDRMRVHIFESNEKLGRAAANDLAAILARILSEQKKAAIIFACANSQLTFLAALKAIKKIDWKRIIIFHMDEYLGMSDTHPASFARFIREKLVNYVHPAEFYPMDGDTPDVRSELKRYADLMHKYPPDVCILGIGENGHLAFNDPPADFDTKDVIHVVNLDLACRTQQVNEGHFPTLNDVPRQALSLSVPALLTAKHVFAIVPEERKAKAVHAALKGPVTPYCPASILRTESRVTMYLDRGSASLL